MKNFISNIFNIIANKCLVIIIGVFSPALFSCVMKYGAPEADYKFNGSITDASTNQTIEGISIIIKEENYIRDSVISDANGRFYSEGWISNYENTLWKFDVKDIDDSLNGEYVPVTISFTSSQVDLTDKDKKDKWDEGTLYRTINFALQPIED
ncbi:MAG: radical SAM-associated putative lipoprotein [Bacteroidota bacterium]